ncbi:DUF4157 domain-containing protein [Salinigranum sp. GCM10025319]|uniref:eCIS core domain-containing protein n=1 Tax=Salinigranum sp. GCM10025319 TaxID=3252687 RepID=UPI00361EC6CB
MNRTHFDVDRENASHPTRATERRSERSDPAAPGPVASLHRTIGNQALQSALGDATDEQAPDEPLEREQREKRESSSTSRLSSTGRTALSTLEPGSDVRVNTGHAACRFLDVEDASAAARGREIRVRPAALHAPEGRRLLAHEFAHVLQQRASGLPRASRARREADADAFAADLLSGRPTGVTVSAPTRWAFQRGESRSGASIDRLRVDRNAGTVTMVTSDGARYVYEVGECTIPNGKHTAIGEGSELTVQVPGETVLTFRKGAISTSETPRPGDLSFSGQVSVAVTEGDSGRTSQSSAAGAVVGDSAVGEQSSEFGEGETRSSEENTVGKRRSSSAEEMTSAESTTETRGSTGEETGSASTVEETESTDERTPELRPVVEPTPIEVPDWIPRRARTAIETGDYSTLAEYRAREGLYRLPGAGGGPFGDVIVWERDIGSGYRKAQVFQMFPDDPNYYRQFAEESEFQLEMFHSVFTEYNEDLWYYVSENGMSIVRARAQLREDATERAKLVFQAAAALFEAGFGGLAMAGGTSQAGRASQRSSRRTQEASPSTGTTRPQAETGSPPRSGGGDPRVPPERQLPSGRIPPERQLPSGRIPPERQLPSERVPPDRQLTGKPPTEAARRQYKGTATSKGSGYRSSKLADPETQRVRRAKSKQAEQAESTPTTVPSKRTRDVRAAGKAEGLPPEQREVLPRTQRGEEGRTFATSETRVGEPETQQLPGGTVRQIDPGVKRRTTTATPRKQGDPDRPTRVVRNRQIDEHLADMREEGIDFSFRTPRHKPHAEVKQIVANPNRTVHVDRPMCGSCREFFKAEAMYRNEPQVVVDPQATRTFYPDGTVVHRFNDGSVTRIEYRPGRREDGTIEFEPVRVRTTTPPSKGR